MRSVMVLPRKPQVIGGRQLTTQHRSGLHDAYGHPDVAYRAPPVEVKRRSVTVTASRYADEYGREYEHKTVTMTEVRSVERHQPLLLPAVVVERRIYLTDDAVREVMTRCRTLGVTLTALAQWVPVERWKFALILAAKDPIDFSALRRLSSFVYEST